MLTTDKILAHKTHGKNLILLTQVESSYFFVVAQVIQTKSLFSRKNSKGTLKTIFQKQVSEIEALAIFNELSGVKTNQTGDENNKPLLLASTNTTISSTEAVTLLLEGTVQKTDTKTPENKPQPVVSPYFPTKDIFLSVQKTRAPAFI
jgi:hypothetical protein